MGLKVYRGKATTIVGVGDTLNLKTSSYADLNVTIDENCFNISGAIVESICSDIRMENFTSLQKYGHMRFSMEFGGANAKNFRIDVLLGLDVLASLVSGNKLDKNGESPILAKRMADMICLEISKKKCLPFGINPMRSHSGDEPLQNSNPTSRRALVTLGGPSPALAATLDVVLAEFLLLRGVEVMMVGHLWNLS